MVDPPVDPPEPTISDFEKRLFQGMGLVLVSDLKEGDMEVYK